MRRTNSDPRLPTSRKKVLQVSFRKPMANLDIAYIASSTKYNLKS